jgi:hypothetical protein
LGDFDAVTAALAAVGLGTVPAWLRPFPLLSNGEKFRANLARAICEAPKLTRKLHEGEWSEAKLCTLIFHPSILPYHRGPDAIRWVVALGERVSGVTWFWCGVGLDTGPICEQEPVLLKLGESPGRAYHTRFAPAGLRGLSRALAGIACGCPRRVMQETELASYESRWPSPAAPQFSLS